MSYLPIDSFGLGVLAGASIVGICRQLARWLTPVRLRCAWCGRVRVSAKGQACAACLEAVAKDGRAAPDGWPEA